MGAIARNSGARAPVQLAWGRAEGDGDAAVPGEGGDEGAATYAAEGEGDGAARVGDDAGGEVAVPVEEEDGVVAAVRDAEGEVAADDDVDVADEDHAVGDAVGDAGGAAVVDDAGAVAAAAAVDVKQTRLLSFPLENFVYLRSICVYL